MSNKTTIKLIIAGLLIIIAIVALMLIFRGNKQLANEGNNNPSNSASLPAPDFLNAAEKADLNAKGVLDLSPDAKVQALSRDASGQAMTIKIINTEADIVVDPSSVRPISPRNLPE